MSEAEQLLQMLLEAAANATAWDFSDCDPDVQESFKTLQQLCDDIHAYLNVRAALEGK